MFLAFLVFLGGYLVVLVLTSWLPKFLKKRAARRAALRAAAVSRGEADMAHLGTG